MPTTPLPTSHTGSSVITLRRVRDHIATVALVAFSLVPSLAQAQRVVRQPEQVVSVSKGASVLVITQTPLQRFSVGDPAVAEAVVVSPTEVLVNGKTLGTTTLVLWDNANAPRLYSVEVTADAPGLERYLRQLLPDEQINVTATGNSVTLSGTVRDASSANRAVEIARGSGATIIDNLSTPDAVQVLLQVRFAEVNRSVVKSFNVQTLTLNPHKLDDGGDWRGATNGTLDGGALQGAIDVGLFSPNASIEALIRALTTKGQFKSLAEPNLIAMPGKEASFLAGGEFPYPSVQGGGASNSVSIIFKEFGIRLHFTPTITRNGSIRIKVAPEVSSLDFANALVISGFTIPSLITRRAETEVEMREGQYLAIAGLMDNTLIDNVSKIPVLGDIPILGQFFRSKEARQNRTELLVLITPKLIRPSDQAIPLPTGEPQTWQWNGFMAMPKGGFNPTAPDTTK
jgi:pilus assembly protein CpaC